jgi:hypothetical protein
MATEWTTVRVSRDNDSKLFLEMLRENLDFADEVREIILNNK